MDIKIHSIICTRDKFSCNYDFVGFTLLLMTSLPAGSEEFQIKRENDNKPFFLNSSGRALSAHRDAKVTQT